MQFLPRPAFIATLSLAALVATSSAASAHVEAKPTRVRPGSTTAVTFTIGHGCNGSPTDRVVLRLPADVAFLKAGAMPKGWTGPGPAPAPSAKVATTKATATSMAIATTKDPEVGATITLRGPGLDPKRHHAFALTLRFPTTTGTVLIPTIQGCVKGTQGWISSSADADYPAPRIMVR